MKAGPFNAAVAQAYAVDEKTVVVYTRALKEAGLMTTGARGINAPHMRPIDAARVTIALLATDNPSRAVERVRRFGALPLNKKRCNGDLPAEWFPTDDLTFENVMVRLFASAAESVALGSAPYVEVNENGKTARIEFHHNGDKAEAFFQDTDRSQAQLSADRAEHGGIRHLRGLAASDLSKLWAPLWASRYIGCDEQGLPLDMTHPWNDELRGDARVKRYEEINAYLTKSDSDWLRGAE
jgi:hypothetical protein